MTFILYTPMILTIMLVSVPGQGRPTNSSEAFMNTTSWEECRPPTDEEVKIAGTFCGITGGRLGNIGIRNEFHLYMACLSNNTYAELRCCPVGNCFDHLARECVEEQNNTFCFKNYPFDMEDKDIWEDSVNSTSSKEESKNSEGVAVVPAEEVSKTNDRPKRFLDVEHACRGSSNYAICKRAWRAERAREAERLANLPDVYVYP